MTYQRQPAPEPLCGVCGVCGERLGLHRYGDDACRNPEWRAGNGQSQWLRCRFQWSDRYSDAKQE